MEVLELLVMPVGMIVFFIVIVAGVMLHERIGEQEDNRHKEVMKDIDEKYKNRRLERRIKELELELSILKGKENE